MQPKIRIESDKLITSRIMYIDHIYVQVLMVNILHSDYSIFFLIIAKISENIRPFS